MPEFGNRFYTLNTVTTVIQEMACRVVAVFGIKTGSSTTVQGLGFFLVLYTYVLLLDVRVQLCCLFGSILGI